MGVTKRCRTLHDSLACNDAGQMTVELAVAFPVLIIVALIATNATLFLSECAAFDRLACDAVRAFATAPAYGSGVQQSCADVEQALQGQFARPYLAVSVSCENAGFDFVRFRATLRFTPTLFGMGMRSEVFGVSLPALLHETTYVVDTYKPGVVV